MHTKTGLGRYAYEKLHGLGLEIGALHTPFELASDAQVIYLDYASYDELITEYSGNNDVPLELITKPHLVAKTIPYAFIDANSFDFVCNSHVLEHLANPGIAIEEFLRITKPNGLVYMIVPDKRYCFDHTRETTPLDHLMSEYRERVTDITLEHYQDFCLNADFPTRHLDIQIKEFWLRQSSIHVHTFTADTLKAFLDWLAPLVGFEIEFYHPEHLHIHVCLKKI